MGNIGDAAFSSGDIMRRLRDLERRLDELSSARRLENSTIGVGGIRVASQGVIRSDTFDGNLPLGDEGENGWALGADRLAIRGQFVSPFDFDRKFNRTDNWALTSTETTRATVTFTPPDWADQIMIMAGFSGQAENHSGSQDYLIVKSYINGVNEYTQNFNADPLYTAAGGMTDSAIIDLASPGQTVTVETRVNCVQPNWGSVGPDTNVNNAKVSALAIFKRAN